jgi:hypothetical protein
MRAISPNSRGDLDDFSVCRGWSDFEVGIRCRGFHQFQIVALDDRGRISGNRGYLPNIFALRQPIRNRTMPKAVRGPWLEFGFSY